MSKRTGGRLHKEDRRGGVPDIGRELQLTPQHVPPPGENPEETEATWGSSAPPRVVNPWLAVFLGLIIATVIGVVGTGIWMALRPNASPTTTPGTAEGSDSPIANLPAEQLNAAIETTVRGYLGANNELARCHWVVGGQRTLAALREYHSRPEVNAPQSFGRIIDIGPAAFDSFPMHMVVAAEADGVTGHLLSVFPLGDRLLVDWESSVGLGELSWEKFLSTKPTQPVQMRVYLERDSYFNHAFADDSRWDSYQVSTRGYPDTLHAFVEKDTDLGKQIEHFVLPGASQPVNLRLHWADEGRALLITELIHNYWVDVDRLRRLSNR